MAITANDIKVNGIKVIKEAIEDGLPHLITERGKPAFYAISLDDHNEFQEWRLDKAIKEAQADHEAGNVQTITDVGRYIDSLIDNKERG